MQEVAERSAEQMQEPVHQQALIDTLQTLERAADDLIAQLPQQGEAGTDEVQDAAFRGEDTGAQPAVDLSRSAVQRVLQSAAADELGETTRSAEPDSPSDDELFDQ